MKNVGIVCGIHYPALHSNSIYTNNYCGYEGRIFECPKSKKLQTRTTWRGEWDERNEGGNGGVFWREGWIRLK